MPIYVDSAHEQAAKAFGAAEPKKVPPRGTSKYMRKAVVRVFTMTDEQRKTYKPRNGYEEAALALFERTKLKNSVGNSAFQLVRDTLGEKVEAPAKEQNSGRGDVHVSNDVIPTPNHKAN